LPVGQFVALVSSPSQRVVAYRLDAVSVGVAQEGGVIGRVIVAQSRRAVIGAAGRHAGVPERVDLGLPSRLEAPMAAERLVGFWALADGEIDAVRIGRPRPLAITEPVFAAADLDHAERLHDGVIEPLGGGDVGYGDGDVIQHELNPLHCAFKPTKRRFVLFLSSHRSVTLVFLFLNDFFGRICDELFI
jgi:hypothetical protein